MPTGEPQLFSSLAVDDARDVVLRPIGTDPQAFSPPLFFAAGAGGPSAPEDPGDPPTEGPGGSLVYRIPAGLSSRQKKALAALLACAPCCGGSGSGALRPNGCSPCVCCPDICWWKTTWPNQWTTDSGKWETFAPAPEWVMTEYTMTLATGLDEYYWGGEILGDPSFCTLNFCGKLESDGTVSDPGPILSGVVKYTRSIAPFDTVTFNVAFYPNISIQFPCDNPSGYVFCSYGGFTSDGGFDGQNIPGSTGNGFLDFALANSIGTEEDTGDTSTCGFTASSPTDIGLPPITIIPVP